MQAYSRSSLLQQATGPALAQPLCKFQAWRHAGQHLSNRIATNSQTAAPPLASRSATGAIGARADFRLGWRFSGGNRANGCLWVIPGSQLPIGPTFRPAGCSRISRQSIFAAAGLPRFGRAICCSMPIIYDRGNLPRRRRCRARCRWRISHICAFPVVCRRCGFRSFVFKIAHAQYFCAGCGGANVNCCFAGV